jgi:hypothetical protein
MSANKYKITRSSLDRQIDIPIEIKWDFYGQEENLSTFQEETVSKAIGKPKDFELARFQNKQYFNSYDTSVNYNFYFYTGLTNDFATTIPDRWGITYNSQGFTNEEIYYTSKPFLNSFFKLDFYDTNQTKTQKNYFTIILPANQSTDELKSISNFLPDVKISIPKYNLDFINQKEGYFIYWLKSREFYNLDTFYMSAKFFNGSTGQFVRLINTSQADPELASNKYNFSEESYFYYKLKLDYSNFDYEVFNYKTGTDIRIGSMTNPIKWYEYVNPQ